MLLDCCVKLINCSPTQTGAAQPVALATLGKTVVQCEMHLLFMPPLKKNGVHADTKQAQKSGGKAAWS